MQKTLREQLIQALRLAITELFSLSPDVLGTLTVDVALPTEKAKADYVSNVAFQLAKKVGAAPLAVAESLAAHMNKQIATSSLGVTVTASAPGFLNISCADAVLAGALATALKAGATYGASQRFAGQTWEIEHTSPNPNKPMHIGHLRNNVLSMALVHLVEFAGARVIAEAVDNNRGIAIARAMWGFLISKQRGVSASGAAIPATDPAALLAAWVAHPEQWLTPADENMKPDHFVGQCYLAGVDAAKKDPASDAAIRDLALKWEQDNADVWKLWQCIIDYAHEGIEVTLKRLGNRWDHIWHEHEHYKMGKRIVEDGLAKGIFARGDEGAIITQLAEFKTPDTVLLKSDGTALYITQDLALTQLKKEKYHAQKYVWVIGPEQSLAMKQLFLVAQQLGLGTVEDFVHVTYGLVNMVDANGVVKKMSSRGGETILADELLDETKASLLAAERDYTPDMAESLAVSAVKYSLLRAARNSNIIFSTQKALSMEGDSGVYVLYTYARMKSVIAKAAADAGVNAAQQTSLPADTTFSPLERALAVEILHFPLLVEKAIDELSPHVLVEYITHISQRFNALYAQEQFVTADNARNTVQKVVLTNALAHVSEIVFALLGMKPLERV